LRVIIKYGNWPGNLNIPLKFKEIVKEIGIREKKKLGEICFIFVSEIEILRINQEFLKHDYVTDVISFSNGGKLTVSGDIFISPDTVFSNAVYYRSGNYHELYRVMVHGVLHLAGFEDRSTLEKEKMREREDFYLGLGKEFNYLDF
jgi:probable rRNA maturation factor